MHMNLLVTGSYTSMGEACSNLCLSSLATSVIFYSTPPLVYIKLLNGNLARYTFFLKFLQHGTVKSMGDRGW